MLLWVVGARRDGHGVLRPDPSGNFQFPLSGRYRNDTLDLSAPDLSLQFSFGSVPLRLFGRRAFAIGGYLAFLVVPTIVAGILADNLENADNLRLLAFAAVPIHTARNLYPDSPSVGDPTDTAWALTWLVLIALSVLVLAWRFRGDEA